MKKHRQTGIPFFRLSRNLRKKDRNAIEMKYEIIYRILNGDRIINQEVVVSDAISWFRNMDYEEA